MNNAYIVSTVRTAIGKSPRGSLRHQRPEDLATQVVQGAIAKIPQLEGYLIDDVIFGCAFPEAEQGLNIGRIIAQKAGLPDSVSGMTVNRLCASGLQAIVIGSHSIMAGSAEIVIAGGVESMSLIPMGGNHLKPDAQLMKYLPDAYISMGITAENVAQQYHISRLEQDEFALASHQKAAKAIKSGYFKEEIIPLQIKQNIYQEGEVVNQESIFDSDEGLREDTTLEALSSLKPVFNPRGTVTAGNSSQMSDGAAATILMSEKWLKKLGVKPLAKLLGYVVVGVPAGIMGIAPVEAIPKVLKQVGLDISDIGLIELNEAFASQSVAVMKKLALNPDIINVNGGAIALGHPLGCTGAKLTATLIHEMQRRNVRYGMVTMCIGGGMGVAAVFELVNN
jgi:acetyl-CoA acyltransferase